MSPATVVLRDARTVIGIPFWDVKGDDEAEEPRAVREAPRIS